MRTLKISVMPQLCHGLGQIQPPKPGQAGGRKTGLGLRPRLVRIFRDLSLAVG